MLYKGLLISKGHRADQTSDENIYRISALAFKKSSNQKTLIYDYVK